MKYHLYDEQERHQGKFESVYELRKFLCDRKYDTNCDKDIGCTFDYIKHMYVVKPKPILLNATIM